MILHAENKTRDRIQRSLVPAAGDDHMLAQRRKCGDLGWQAKCKEQHKSGGSDHASSYAR